MKAQTLAAVAVFTFGVPAAIVVPAVDAGATATTKPAPKPAVCNPKTAAKGITVAFNQFLSASTATEKVRFVDQGIKVQDAVGRSAQVAVTSGSGQAPLEEIAVNFEVTCTTRSKASFVFDLQLKQTATGVTTPPLGLRQPGEAVLKRGSWYLSGLTVCGFAALNPDAANQPAVTACYQALGRAVPVPTT